MPERKETTADADDAKPAVVDGTAVGRAVRRVVHPLLKAAGFSTFTGRKGWRFSEETTELVDVRSFTRYVADGVGCTTFSFTATTGVFFRCLDRTLEKPQDYHLTFRVELGKAIHQPWFRPYGGDRVTDRADVWFVKPDGSNLDECVTDLADQLRMSGLPLLDRLRNPQSAFEALLTETSSPPDFGIPGVTMPGAPDSPRWRDTSLAIGHLVTDDPRERMRTAPVLDSGAH